MKKAIIFICFFICIKIIPLCAQNNYLINGMFSITVSDLLELRQDNDAYTRFLRDTLNYDTDSQTVFQQKSLSNKSQDALARYCRITIVTVRDESGPYPTSDDEELTPIDKQEFAESATAELGPGQEFVVKPIVSTGETKSGNKYFLVHYIRSGYNGDVDVRICYFFNYKYCAKVIFSYRLSEANIWKSSLDNALNSFTWKHPYISNIVVDNNIEETNKTEEIETTPKPNMEMFISGLLIGGVIIGVIALVIYLSINEKKKKRAEIEKGIQSINSQLDNENLISAKKQIDSLRKACSTEYVEYKKQLDQCVDKLNNKTEKLNKSVTAIIDTTRENLLAKDNPQTNDSKISNILNNPEVPNETKKKLNAGLKEIDEEYRKGIIPDQEEAYTKYVLPSCNNTSYCYYSSPQKGTIVFPYRRHKIELRGYTESAFEVKLRSAFTNYANYRILGDVSILPANGYHAYEPDISIVEKNNKYGIRVDIEIDEPYSGVEKRPIHYVGCGDDFRDLNLNNMGWIVIRFSEKQIYKEADKCINYIMYILSQIDKDSNFMYSYIFPNPDKKWTEVEAKLMAARNYREKLLNHKFGLSEVEEYTNTIPQTELEKKAAQKVAPIIIPHTPKVNLDHSSKSFSLDDKLTFSPEEHIYLYNGKIQLTPVSSVIDHFFWPFDVYENAERVARRDGRNVCEVIEEWESKGIESREVGTFLHSQIEAYFFNKPINYSTRFVYDGEYINIDKTVSIKEEMEYFRAFMRDTAITPFRTEWRICDVNLGIAGTIDLLAKNGDSYDIYDWKRSRKASPKETVWKFGINGLEHVPDISFYHYAIQQNLYKYILEKNYGIKIANMYIVVMHSNFSTYYKYPIPKLDKEIKTIINKIPNIKF